MAVRPPALLLHPLFTGAIALLAVNDHLLKGWAPGWFTGKASDFAGVVVVALLAGTVLRRPTALAATAVGWVGLKTVPEASALVAPILGGPTRTDPTDLVALLGLWPAGRLLAAGPVEARPAAREVGRSVLTSVVLAATVLTVTATSCEPATMVVGFETSGEGSLVAVVEYGSLDSFEQPVVWARSDDGGLTWTAAAHERSGDPGPALEACRSDGRCFRVRPDEGVDEQVAGQWELSFAFTDEEILRMKARGDSCSGAGWPEDLFTAITTVAVDDGQAVLVAMGSQGALRLDPATDEWERVAVVGLRPTPLHGARWLQSLYLVPALVMLASPIALLLGWRRGTTGRGVIVMLTTAGIAGFLLASAGFLIFINADYAVAGPTIAGLSVLVFMVSLWVARRPPPRLPPPPSPPSPLPPPPPN
ncbi:MAG: hypothetical protein GY929_10265 [Actinomycetia bacterium]|nr:hypothetical protein [Actinomycetes bacterium]